jgi:glycosyltransferase involved in cell wall biosynthesis
LRVLVASPFVPWPLDSGGRIRSFELLHHAARQVQVELLAVDEGRDHGADLARLAPHFARLEILPRSAPTALARAARPKVERWFHSAALAHRLAEADRSGAYDLIQLDELPLARLLPRAARTRTLLHHPKLDREFQQQSPARGPAAAWDRAKLARLERVAALRHRHHLVCSAEDRALLLGRYPELDVAVVQNGYDPGRHRPRPDLERARERLLFLGSLDYGPNVDGLRWFVAEVWPRIRRVRPAAELELVGRDPCDEVRSLVGPGVLLRGPVAEVGTHLGRAALLVVPLRIGGGTRLKIAEALGAETPVVSTPVGAEGLELLDREHLRLAADAESFAAAVLELLADPAAAAALARRGRAEAERRLRWETLADRLVGHWRRIAGGS